MIMRRYAQRRLFRRVFVFLVVVVFLTIVYNYQTLDWMTNYLKYNFVGPDPPLEAQLESEKNPRILNELIELVYMRNPRIYEELIELVSSKNPHVLEGIIELVSPKDPKCRPNNSTFDPFSNFDRTTAIQLAHLLLAYRQQHIRWRKLLLEGSVDKIRTLTWYCDSMCGGLGDRVRSIGFSLMLAMISNRLLLLQWRQPFEVERQKNIFEPAAIDWNLDQALADKLLKLSSESVTMFMTETSQSRRAYLIETYITSSKYRHVRIKTNIVFNGLVQLHPLLTAKTLKNEMYQTLMNVAVGEPPTLSDSIHGVFVRYLFKFSPTVLERAEQLIKEIHMSHIKEYVVANIRSGFVGTLDEGEFFATHSEQWGVVLDHAVNKSKQLGIVAPVVLCCDSENIKSWANAHYSEKVIPIPREPVHVDKMHVADKVNAEIETAAELVIMSRSTFLYRAYRNGFTNVAVHMCPFVKSQSHFFL